MSARYLSQRLILGCIWVYKHGLSWMLPPCCRFTPSCSAYAREAVIVHGPWLGMWLACRRLCRCHPFYHGSVYDPVPQATATQDAPGNGTARNYI